jgi:hypothetical protein
VICSSSALAFDGEEADGLARDEAVQRIAGFGGGVDSQRATPRFNETRLRKER